MITVSRAAMAFLFASSAISPVVAQSGSRLTAVPGRQTVQLFPTAKTITAKEFATMPKKMVNGQQMVFSNNQWSRIVASGGGNYQIVASGGGN